MSITAHTLATAVSPHIYWITSRAAGIVGLLLSSISVCVGLLMGGRLLKGRQPDLRVTHEALSLATLGALAVHGLTLIGDGFLHPSLGDVAVPFLSGYKTLWTGAGCIDSRRSPGPSGSRTRSARERTLVRHGSWR
jgi:sulfoxide reductase heme-binding subunit YedZ